MSNVKPRVPDVLLAIDSIANAPFAVGALLLAAAGFYVLPVGDKKPLVRWGDKATTDAETIQSWGRRWPDAGVAIACKPSGLLVVDLDVKHPPVNGCREWEGLTLASGDPTAAPACLYDRTSLIKTASGGLHLWFANPEGIPGRNNMLPGIDVKAAEGRCGGYTLAPPSPGYAVLGPKSPMPLPGWLALILTHDDKPYKAKNPPAPPVAAGIRNGVDLERLAAALRERKA